MTQLVQGNEPSDRRFWANELNCLPEQMMTVERGTFVTFFEGAEKPVLFRVRKDPIGELGTRSELELEAIKGEMRARYSYPRPLPTVRQVADEEDVPESGEW